MSLLCAPRTSQNTVIQKPSAISIIRVSSVVYKLVCKLTRIDLALIFTTLFEPLFLFSRLQATVVTYLAPVAQQIGIPCSYSHGAQPKFFYDGTTWPCMVFWDKTHLARARNSSPCITQLRTRQFTSRHDPTGSKGGSRPLSHPTRSRYRLCVPQILCSKSEKAAPVGGRLVCCDCAGMGGIPLGVVHKSLPCF